MKKRSLFLTLTVLMLLAFIVLTVLVKTVDIGAIGPVDPLTGANTKVGFSAINSTVHTVLPLNRAWYTVSKYLGFFPFALIGVFALWGLCQLFNRKSFIKVDFALYMQALLYILIGGEYVFFEKFIVNYRPAILDVTEWPEASYPSSHTVLAVSVLGSAIILLYHYFKNKRILFYCMESVLFIVMVWGIGTRVLSGVHWASDIVAGLLLGLLFVFFFCFLLTFDKTKQ